MYPLHSAQLRLAVLRLAANRAVDRAMRSLHDRGDLPPTLVMESSADAFAAALYADSSTRFHERMKVDESNCRWCGLARREALEELEASDG